MSQATTPEDDIDWQHPTTRPHSPADIAVGAGWLLFDRLSVVSQLARHLRFCHLCFTCSRMRAW